MKILVPMAGPSPGFSPDDYPYPKPMIEIAGRPMVDWAVQNLKTLSGEARFVFVVMQAEAARYSYEGLFDLATEGRSAVVGLRQPTAGMLCSCLMAIDHIEPDEPLFIANSDQIIRTDLSRIRRHFEDRNADAGVVTFDSIHPRWSYVKLDGDGNALQFAEKQVISRNAIAGLYYFRRGAEFVEAAKWSIRHGQTVDGRYYVAPALNHYILKGRTVVAAPIDAGIYHSFYTPQTLTAFERELTMGRVRPAEAGEINVVIPAAGAGSRFVAAGYPMPKPFIDVEGKTMVERVLDNVGQPGARVTLLLRREHLDEQAGTVSALHRAGYRLVPVEKLTEGTACTVLLARRHIDDDRPLLIANSDQLVDFDCGAFIRDCIDRDLDGSILVFRDPTLNPKWSFAKLDERGHVVEVAEKKPISDLATVGIYLYRRGKDFVRAAIDMIALNDRVNGEFYTCPTYTYAIRNGLRIGVYEVPQAAMHGLGTPEDLEAYLAGRGGAR
jgi:dTDP-glucose pyrophosphorylase